MTAGFETSNQRANSAELHNAVHDRVHAQLNGLKNTIDIGQVGKQVEDLKDNFVTKMVDGFGDKLSGLPGLLEKAKTMNIKIPQWLALAVTYCANQPKAVAATIQSAMKFEVDIAKELQNGVPADKMLDTIAKTAKARRPGAKDPLKDLLAEVTPKPGETPIRTISQLSAAVAKLQPLPVAPAVQPAATAAAAPAAAPASTPKTA